jgi:hypothetical protein
MAHWKLLLRCIKYVITTEYLALKVKLKGLEGITNRNYMTQLEGISHGKNGTDQGIQISVFGWNFYFCCALISWKSKIRNSVTL